MLVNYCIDEGQHKELKMTERLKRDKTNRSQVMNKDIVRFSKRIEEMLKKSGDVAGITAEYIMAFLDSFDDDREQLLIFALCSNFYRIEQSIERRLSHKVSEVAECCSDSCINERIDIDFLDAIGEYLAEKEKGRQQASFCDLSMG